MELSFERKFCTSGLAGETAVDYQHISKMISAAGKHIYQFPIKVSCHGLYLWTKWFSHGVEGCLVGAISPRCSKIQI